MILKPLALLAVNVCSISLASAAVVFEVTESPDTIYFVESSLSDVSSTDLAADGVGSFSSLLASGISGSALELNDGDVPVAYNTDQNTGFNQGDAFTVNFDLSVNTAGYTITSIVSTVGGNQRAAQGYDVRLTFVDDRTAVLISSDDAPGVVSGTAVGYPDEMTYFSNLYTGWSRIEITEDSSGILATGVKSITFDNFKPANRAGENGYVPYREFDINGVPTVALVASLSTESDTVSAPFTVALSFPEAVLGLEESDLVISNGSVTAASLSGSGASYSVEITPAASGKVAVYLPADTVDATDGSLSNVASQTLTTIYVAPGGDQPVVVLSTATAGVNGVYQVEVDFTEAVSGLELSDFVVGNAWLSYLTGSGSSYSLLVTPGNSGDVLLSLPAWTSLDVDGDNLGNSASNELITTYIEQLSVAIYGPMVSAQAEFELYLTFSEAIAGLEVSDFEVNNGRVTSIVEQGRRDFSARYFIVSVAADAQDVVSLKLPAGAVVDAATLTAGNVASHTFSVICDADFGEDWIIDDATEWAAATLSTSDLALVEGSAEPTADASQFTSVIKSFSVKQKAQSLTFKQSPVWDNWTVAANYGPASGAGNAPILVPVADQDYYFLAQSGNDGYHAWHSTDMQTWIKYGQVTAPEHNWVTTAEYKDGLFYIYVDYPNDHTPHLYIDRDLKDGQTEAFLGMVFNDPTSGSDSAVIRDNADGLFHLISEDYTPVHAPSHAFDSPLVTHTSSEDGITGYQPAEHLPPIDRRTVPTGEMGTWNHPHVEGSLISNPIPYEIHEPEQDAFGDWTAIKIGEQYYLFGDYHHSDGSSITAARFTSTSIYEEFELVGSMDSGGHPDPTVGFAEGQFYLITQYDDFTSPGPWVDGVQARAGVDIDGDGEIDQWTVWQGIAEQYDHTPNFVRVVSLTPAQLDLSELPDGYGFQFEFQIDATVVADVSPIIDRVEMAFAPSNFQQWANDRRIPAQSEADYNANSMPDVIEFSIGQSVLPERQADGRLTVTAINEAIADGLEVQLWFSDDLDQWYLAQASTEGVKLISDTVDGSGNHQLIFEIFDRVGGQVFWRLAVTALIQ
ncbi:Ig-like domain-containing protein [Coraliomargarita sp. W4R72]